MAGYTSSNSDPAIIMFDGVCNLCNGWVNFVIDHDPNHHFKFAALQSEFARQLLSGHGRDPDKLDSIVLYKNGKLYDKSRAALEVSRGLKGLWPAFYGFIIVPGFIRNLVYNTIAKNRYKWFGKWDHCRVPDASTRDRFMKDPEPAQMV